MTSVKRRAKRKSKIVLSVAIPKDSVELTEMNAVIATYIQKQKESEQKFRPVIYISEDMIKELSFPSLAIEPLNFTATYHMTPDGIKALTDNEKEFLESLAPKLDYGNILDTSRYEHPNPPTIDNVRQVMGEGVVERDHIKVMAAQVAYRNMYLMGDL